MYQKNVCKGCLYFIVYGTVETLETYSILFGNKFKYKNKYRYNFYDFLEKLLCELYFTNQFLLEKFN